MLTFFSVKQRILVYLVRQVLEMKRTSVKDCKKLAFLSNLDFKNQIVCRGFFGDSCLQFKFLFQWTFKQRYAIDTELFHWFARGFSYSNLGFLHVFLQARAYLGVLE